MAPRDRIKELRRVRAAELLPNPRNWRKHPPAQQSAMRGLLADIGYAGALLARELADGSLELLDGHLRAATTPQAIVPVLVVDVTDEEAAKILATHDAITPMAVPDFGPWRSLLDDCRFEFPAAESLFESSPLAPREESVSGDGHIYSANAFHHAERDGHRPRRKKEINIAESYQVVVTCANEEQQRTVFERLRREGYACRLLML